MMGTQHAVSPRSRQGSQAQELWESYLSRDMRLLRTDDRDPTRRAPVHLVCVHINKGYWLEGRIDVANIVYEKDIGVRVSWDNWKTYTDIRAHYVSSHENNNNTKYAKVPELYPSEDEDEDSDEEAAAAPPIDVDDDKAGHDLRAPGLAKLPGVKKEKKPKEPPKPPEPQPPVDRFFFRQDLTPHVGSSQSVLHLEFQLCAWFRVPGHVRYQGVWPEYWDSNGGRNYRVTGRFPSAYEVSLVKEFLPGYGQPELKKSRQQSKINKRYNTIDRLADSYRSRVRSPTSTSPTGEAALPNGVGDDAKGTSADTPEEEERRRRAMTVPTKGTCECGD